MRPSRGVDKLPRNPHARACFADAAFEDVTNPQFLPNLLHIHGSALVCEARIAGDYETTPETRQSRNDFFDHPIREVLLLAVATQVLKWQDGNGWLLGQ